MSAPGGTIEAPHLSPEISAMHPSGTAPGSRRSAAPPANLAAAVEQMERDLIQAALDRSGGNISESARTLGLTRRGLYLKLRRLGLESRSESEVDTM